MRGIFVFLLGLDIIIFYKLEIERKEERKKREREKKREGEKGRGKEEEKRKMVESVISPSKARLIG